MYRDDPDNSVHGNSYNSVAMYITHELGLEAINDGIHSPYIVTTYYETDYTYFVPYRDGEVIKYYAVRFDMNQQLPDIVKEIKDKIQELKIEDQIKSFVNED